MARRGRKAQGVKLVDKHEGSEAAKRRLKVILRTITGDMTVADACAELGVGETAFYKLREQFISDSVGLLEPKKPGRKPRTEDPRDEQICSLKQEVHELKYDIETGRVRELIAATMPHLLEDKPPKPRKEPRAKKKRAKRLRRKPRKK